MTSMVIPDLCSVRRILCLLCGLSVPQYSFVLADPTDVPLEECCFARPQLYFPPCYLRVKLRHRDGRSPTGRRTYGDMERML